ncbi:hypothetical protein CJ030_MR5G000974 [Morella rubra]|uniref:Uncharacterized protein n=1 Tax=Morella rubra TaxID=262757 RepID=A0A6A1VGV6_9ROSI|nr:hypothetical protein CJ030_MR5G000974 [Morella rubra]
MSLIPSPTPSAPSLRANEGMSQGTPACPSSCALYIKCQELSARTTRTGTGSSSQEQEVADPMMTLERRMEYLRGRPVAKERPVMLSDFDSYYRAPEVQLEVRGVQFLFSADVIADFLHCPRPETPCFPVVPLTDEQRTSEQDLWTLMTGKTSAVVGSIIKQSEFSEFWRILHLIWTLNVDGRSHSTECMFTRAQCMLLLGQQTQIDFPLYMFELIMDEAWGIKEYSLPYGVFLTQFLISQGVVIAARIHDHFDLDYTHQEDVRTMVETMMTARQTHHNRMHAYFKKFPSKEAALLKPHPDTTEEQWKELCNLFTSKAFMKNQESSNINPAELYKKNYTNKDGIWTSEGEREIYHQLAKARDEIEAMRAAREKDLQEFSKKQAEMEATLRDHREEQRVEQERIRLEQEERMKMEQERMRVEHESACERNKSACERSKSAYGQKYRRNWRRKCPL